jgi:hypothetical protein
VEKMWKTIRWEKCGKEYCEKSVEKQCGKQ